MNRHSGVGRKEARSHDGLLIFRRSPTSTLAFSLHHHHHRPTMSNSLQHIPAHTTEELRSMKKKEAVVAYETEVQYFAGMGDVMPELDDEHREDVELAVADMEQQQVRGRRMRAQSRLTDARTGCRPLRRSWLRGSCRGA